jgi:hypothetical protein
MIDIFQYAASRKYVKKLIIYVEWILTLDHVRYSASATFANVIWFSFLIVLIESI